MQVSLRKANAIQASINEVLKALEFKTEVSINEFQTVDSVVSEAATEFQTNMERRTKLIYALYDIRKNVSASNAAAGIDNMLADVARVEKDIVFFSSLAKKQAITEQAVLQGKLDKIASRKETDYYHKNEVETSILTKQQIAEYNATVSSLKKVKQKLQDELLERNVRVTITLGDGTVAVLTQEGII